ncbi:glycosyltransferase family 1 protein [Mitsuokella multacida]|uniref:glycosyltransferase family 1 protein n=1 Tax=Mitsuokella multacida TaxID=52226 RepID=UPI001F475B05|nr:glycosyltransferase family 1 protein [Mitsuokella multacida]MCF2583979.1 glycosyltransferase family 1 protein [Mitsuokella multacida]
MEKPVKVLQIGMTENIGGMETYLMAQYRKLNREKVRYDFLNITGESQIVFSDEIKRNGDSIYAVPSRHKSPLGHYWGVLKLLYQKRHEYKYIVLNTCSLYYVFPLFIAALVGIPHRVIHSHNSGDEIAESLPRKCIKYLNTFLLKISATDYWACSKLAGKWMFKGHPFQVIHNAIDTSKFIFNPAVRRRVRKELGIENKFVIGTVARFSPQKNHEFLIDIFKEVALKRENSVLMLVGDAAGFQDRLNRIKEKIHVYHLEDRVLFLGMRNDTNELYQAMDCHVLPSHFEGLCITALEAQAAGLPCICSDSFSEETAVTRHFYTVNLNASAESWAGVILQYANQERENTSIDFINMGYDINVEIKKMERLFLR